MGCTTYLAAVKERFPAFITFFATDLNGVSFCHTGDQKQIDVSKRAYFANALATGLPLGTIKSRVHLAMKKLRSSLAVAS